MSVIKNVDSGLYVKYRRNAKWKPIREYFEAVKRGDEVAVKGFLNSGISINSVEPTTGLTALHYAASNNAQKLREMLLDLGGIDHLKRDKMGRLASELAGVCGEDLVTARQLRELELAQAQNQHLALTYRPR